MRQSIVFVLLQRVRCTATFNGLKCRTMMPVQIFIDADSLIFNVWPSTSFIIIIIRKIVCSTRESLAMSQTMIIDCSAWILEFVRIDVIQAFRFACTLIPDSTYGKLKIASTKIIIRFYCSLPTKSTNAWNSSYMCPKKKSMEVISGRLSLIQLNLFCLISGHQSPITGIFNRMTWVLIPGSGTNAETMASRCF